MSTPPHRSVSTVDDAEITRFAGLAQAWWDPAGAFRALHRLNPVRLDYIRDRTLAQRRLERRAAHPLAGLSLLDVGCGGGLLCEPMARLGAAVTGIDPGEETVAAARAHAASVGLDIDYRAVTVENLAAAGDSYDVVLAMEVVEHVADVPAFLDACASLVRPGGLFFAASINRTPKAFLLAILGAEYVLGWLPRGTHRYEKLVKPAEIEGPLERAGLDVFDRAGVVYAPLAGEWRLSQDMDVNYMLAAQRPA